MLQDTQPRKILQFTVADNKTIYAVDDSFNIFKKDIEKILHNSDTWQLVKIEY